MRAWLAACLLTLTVLAGCFGGSDGAKTATTGPMTDAALGSGYTFAARDGAGLPVPEVLCRPVLADATAEKHPGAPAGMRCNVNMTPDEGRFGNEVTIAVNPKDARNVVGGAKDYFAPDAGQCVWDGIYVTHDGFNTTTEDRSFDGSPWRLTSDPTSYKPNYASQFWCTTDPVAYFDVNGNLYYLLMAYQADPVTGSKTCADICPPTPVGVGGAFNDWAYNRATQIVAKSSDGGDTFDTFTAVFEGTYPIDFHDKGWVAASKDGTIHVMWLASLVPGNLYFRSTDGGQTFSDPVVMSSTTEAIPGVADATAGQGSFVDVGTEHQVYAAWTSDAIHLRRSNDEGATWDADRAILHPNIATMPGLGPRDRRGISPMMATDRNPDSPFADAVYFVWQQAMGNGSVVQFSASFDQGETFSTPINITSLAATGRDEWEVFPAVSVSPGGVIDVSWFDTEGVADFTLDGAPHHGLTEHYAYSLDGGKMWSHEVDVRDAPGWDPALSHHQNGMIFFGDYQDIDSSWQAAHLIWPDTRDGDVNSKVYGAIVERPWFAQGWDPAKRDAADKLAAAQSLR